MSIYNDVRPIPTEYMGIRYRSKLEAQWAYFFREHSIPFWYEYRTFNLGKYKYTPDFRINPYLFLEVKPEVFYVKDIRKLHLLATRYRIDAFLVAGDFYGPNITITRFSKDGRITFGYKFAICSVCGVYELTNAHTCKACGNVVTPIKYEGVYDGFKAKTESAT